MGYHAGRRRILLADDSATDRLLAARILASEVPGCEVVEAATARELTAQLANDSPDLVITKRALPGLAESSVVEAVKAALPHCPVILLTSPNPDRAVVQDLDAGAFAVLMKSSEGYLLIPHTVEQALLAASAGSAAAPADFFDDFAVGAIRLDKEGRVISANKAARAILGLQAHEEPCDTWLVDFLDDEDAQNRIGGLLENFVDRLDLEAALRRSGDGEAWARIRLRRTPGPEVMWEGSLEDISAYKRKETDLTRRAADLGRSNTELEQFAYVVSHDLQEPLSLIQRYAGLLADQSEFSGNPVAQRYLKQVTASSERMQAMMDAILEFSRVETKGRPFGSVDFNAVVAEARANLGTLIESTGAKIESRDLPVATADHEHMLQLFQNLLSNAIKFRAAARRPEIVVEAEVRPDDVAFAVKDNGIGIPPASRERVFGMFQRLHEENEYPGTGIGLAICRSIVQRHRGTIHLEPNERYGTAVYFTISRNLEDSTR